MSGSPSPESEADAARLPYRIDRNFTRGLVWLRRDLRADDNAALHYALKHCRQVWCVFVFDREILAPLLARGCTPIAASSSSCVRWSHCAGRWKIRAAA
jgi:deoxyribodipyrimidine photo-lyase